MLDSLGGGGGVDSGSAVYGESRARVGDAVRSTERLLVDDVFLSRVARCGAHFYMARRRIRSGAQEGIGLLEDCSAVGFDELTVPEHNAAEADERTLSTEWRMARLSLMKSL